MKRISRVPYRWAELVAGNRPVSGRRAWRVKRRVVPGIAWRGKTTVLAERSLTGKAMRTREIRPSGRTVEGAWLTRRREGARSGRRAVNRLCGSWPAVARKLARHALLAWHALLAAVWRADQAARREDGRRREHLVGVIGWLAPASRGRPPGTRRGRAVTRSRCAGAGWTRTSLAWRNRPGIELTVTELPRRNRSRLHPARHVLTGTVLRRRNRSGPRRRRPGSERARSLHPLRRPRLPVSRGPWTGGPGTRLPRIRLRRTCRPRALPPLAGKPGALRSAHVRPRRVLPRRVLSWLIRPRLIRPRPGTGSLGMRLAWGEPVRRNHADPCLWRLRPPLPRFPVPRSAGIAASSERSLAPGRARPGQRNATLRGVRKRVICPVGAGTVFAARPGISVGLAPPAPPPRKLSHSNDRKQPGDG